jgi:hypothetical protein
MEQTATLNTAKNLEVYSGNKSPGLPNERSEPKTPNEFFAQLYPEQNEIYGSPFIELTQPVDQFTHQILPVSINLDFFAGILGGRKDLGHHVVYYECEMAWYFKDVDEIYRSTTAEKLQNLYRALLMKCSEVMPAQVHKLNLFHEFRSDRVAKQVTGRAKSILAADTSFFSATSQHQRIKGPELIERVARIFVDSLLTSEPGQVLRLHDAYASFLHLLKEKNLPEIKRSDFKAVVGPLIREQFDVALRNDLGAEEGQGVRGWKGVKLLQTVPG